MRPQEVLDFWFQELSPKDQFAKNERIDNEIRRRFLPVLQLASKGDLHEWRNTAQGRFAEIIVLDQFSRNIYRDQLEAFAQDALALALAREMVRLGLDRKIDIPQRAFVYMPYMHSESTGAHEEALKLFEQTGLEDNLRFEHLHKTIIERFGRYPHRNAVLGRDSTREEIEFLRGANSSF